MLFGKRAVAWADLTGHSPPICCLATWSATPFFSASSSLNEEKRHSNAWNLCMMTPVGLRASSRVCDVNRRVLTTEFALLPRGRQPNDGGVSQNTPDMWRI
jgi:hypothetical protein